MNPKFGENSHHTAMSDFAPMYSRRERIRLALILAGIFAPLILLSHFWLLPAINYYASHANCFYYGDTNGVEVVFYGVFVAIPLSSALVMLLILGPRSLRILKAGQDPLPGEKVLRKTRYRYGRAALRFPLVALAATLAFVGIAVWGSLQVDKMTFDIVPCSQQQKADIGIKD